MLTDFIEELKWRGTLHDVMPGTGEQLAKEMTVGYIGFDPTSDSLHVGSLSQIITLLRFQKSGHKPIALVGGATGMVGDPSGKSQERNLLDEETLNYNIKGIQQQLEKFLNFNCGANSAEIVNNYDWFKNYSFLNFIRDAGKHISVNYMMAKDSVQKRLEHGMSFTEFSYQLVQGYDFYHLWKEKKCMIQIGGSDQWGNIVTGTELIRRKGSGHAFALTTQLIKKADGSKFGKSESGNIWLDRIKTSPYKFYQFWLNTSDEDAKNYIRFFTMMSKAEIDELEAKHLAAPHERILQKAIAKDVTVRVHGEADYHSAVNASEILFNGTSEDLGKLDETTFLDIFDGVPRFEISKDELESGFNAVDFLTEKTQIFPSKGEARKMIQGGGVSINKSKIETIDLLINASSLINGKYLMIQKGKKNYYLVIAN
jgi:tyrosyl-tRNA synthetase